VVIAGDDRFARIVGEHVVLVDHVTPYRPGRFAERELPALAAVLDDVLDDVPAERRPDGGPPLDLLLVDGYVDLDPSGRAGLGAQAHQRFGVPVIGVAKTAFRGATQAVPVHRGSGGTRGTPSGRPVFVTAAGLDLARAAELVAAMTGPYRLPDALRRVDALARGANPAGEPRLTPPRRGGA
jgi:deoxyribonuclease V